MYIIEKISCIILFLTVVLFFISYFTDLNIFRGLMFLFLTPIPIINPINVNIGNPNIKLKRM